MTLGLSGRETSRMASVPRISATHRVFPFRSRPAPVKPKAAVVRQPGGTSATERRRTMPVAKAAVVPMTARRLVRRKDAGATLDAKPEASTLEDIPAPRRQDGNGRMILKSALSRDLGRPSRRLGSQGHQEV